MTKMQLVEYVRNVATVENTIYFCEKTIAGIEAKCNRELRSVIEPSETPAFKYESMGNGVDYRRVEQFYPKALAHPSGEIFSGVAIACGVIGAIGGLVAMLIGNGFMAFLNGLIGGGVIGCILGAICFVLYGLVRSTYGTNAAKTAMEQQCYADAQANYNRCKAENEKAIAVAKAENSVRSFLKKQLCEEKIFWKRS